MTISTNNVRIEYAGNSVTTVFAYNFRILNEDHIEVILVSSAGVETVQTKTTHYTVSGVSDSGGGNITMITAPATGESLVLRLNMPFTQNIDYTTGDAFPAETHERGLDERTLENKQVNDEVGRAIRAPKQDASLAYLPTVTNRSNKILGFDANGDPETNISSSDLANLLNNLLVGTEISGYSTVIEHHLGSEFDGANKITLTQSYTPANNNLLVLRNGQLLRKGASFDYTETSSTEVTLTYNPLDNDNFTFVVGVLAASGSIDSANVTYTPGGTGAVDTTVQAILREGISLSNFGATGLGATDDAAAVNAWIAHGLANPGSKLTCPPPSVYYRLESTIEIADLMGVDIEFPGGADLALPAFSTLTFKYEGAQLTGYENPVFRIVGNSYGSIKNLSVDANSLADYTFWIGGVNGYTGSALTTSNLRRSISMNYENLLTANADLAGARIGESTGPSSQTDITTFIRCKFKGTETGVAVDGTPITFGADVYGANTYITMIACEFTGDVGYYHNAGSALVQDTYALNCDHTGFYANSADSQLTLIHPYTEGLDGRAVRLDGPGESTVPKPLSIIGGTFFYATGQSLWFRNNMPVSMNGCFGYGWITDAYASLGPRPVYSVFCNIWVSPTDYSQRQDIFMIGYEQQSGANDYNNIVRRVHNNTATYKDISSANDTFQEGVSDVLYVGVNDGAAKTHTLPSAKAGIRGIRVAKKGAGVLTVQRAGSDVIEDSTSGTSRTQALLATSTDWGWLEFSCFEDGIWSVSSSEGVTVTYA